MGRKIGIVAEEQHEADGACRTVKALQSGLPKLTKRAIKKDN